MLAKWTTRLNRFVGHWGGPAQLGPATDGEGSPARNAQAAEARSRALCPICTEPMALHRIDRSGERTQVHHPSREQLLPALARAEAGR